MKIFQAGFVHVFALLLLLGGIAAGFYLVQQRTNLFSKASELSVRPKADAGLRVTSPPTPAVSAQTFSLNGSLSGINFIGLTVDKGPDYKAEDFLRELNNNIRRASKPKETSSAVWRVEWRDPVTDRLLSHDLGRNDNNFPVKVGEGYYLRSKISTTVSITGTSVRFPKLTVRGHGWTAFSLPALPKGVVRASDLLSLSESLGVYGVVVLQKWENDAWVVFRAALSDSQFRFSPTTENIDFVLKPGEGYMIYNANELSTVDFSSPVLTRLPTTSAPPAPFVCTSCVADIAGKKSPDGGASFDGVVNETDRSSLSSCLGKKSEERDSSGYLCHNRDLTGDGAVTQADMECVTRTFYQRCKR